MISNSMNLVRATKGRNIILTSEARRVLDLRGPYDVMNLYDSPHSFSSIAPYLTI